MHPKRVPRIQKSGLSVTIGSFTPLLRDASLFVKRTQESVVHRSNEPLPILLRYREAAHELGVCERQIHNLVDQNLLEKVKLGSKTARITRSSVLRLAAQRATEPPTAA